MATNILGIGQSALTAAQVGLNTTGHNIANASTPGYSRQVVVQGAALSQNFGYGFMGQGTEVSTVKRVYNEYLGVQVQTAQASKSGLDTYYAQMRQIDNLLADTTVGLSPALQEFFKGVQEVASNPTSVPARQTALSAAESLAARLQGMAGRLREMEQGVNSQVISSVSAINSYAQQIASLNDAIGKAQRASGQAPSSLALRLVEHNGNPGLVLFADGSPPLQGWQESSREGDRPLSLFVPADADSRQRLARLSGSDWLLLQALMSALERKLRAEGDAAPAGWLLVLRRLRAAIDALPARPRHDRIEFGTTAAAGGGAPDGLHFLLHGVDCAGLRQPRWGLAWWPAAGGGDIEWQLGKRGCTEPPLVSWPLQPDGRPAERLRLAAGETGSGAERRQRWLALPAPDLQLMRAVTAAVPDWLEAAAASGAVPAERAAAWQAAARALAGRIDADLRRPLSRRVLAALRGVLR